MSTEEDNSPTAWVIRCAKAAGLREAVVALDDVDPDDVREWLTARAEELEKR